MKLSTKITKKYFGIAKAQDVKVTIGLEDAVANIQLTMLESGLDDDATEVDYLKEQLKLTRTMMDFVQKVVKYTDKQIETIKDSISGEELGLGVGMLIAKIEGATDEDVLKAEEANKNARDKAQESK
ncbi:phage tail tube assembly chaperone [Lactiplantibacillus plantarum]|uniref:phage tail tube assembly chaperone n=1 Tax=Lactiplantibacillus plantarum TaxID=1590 RepID=UPI0018A01FED|nr:phage tail tube assembly chaperone [Lactiplantibacillus plantarum]MDB7778544.1 phage tail tube assembly chaperone [Lactiplantibacillus plantarum]MDB7787521.1 phage tail tube assembly chaperone [Lactiplantibacillus plantarum]MDB7790519.1 phage tail tube assembly chaperone [Lactiplantibacillus plantarum]